MVVQRPIWVYFVNDHSSVCQIVKLGEEFAGEPVQLLLEKMHYSPIMPRWSTEQRTLDKERSPLDSRAGDDDAREQSGATMANENTRVGDDDAPERSAATMAQDARSNSAVHLPPLIPQQSEEPPTSALCDDSCEWYTMMRSAIIAQVSGSRCLEKSSHCRGGCNRRRVASCKSGAGAMWRRNKIEACRERRGQLPWSSRVQTQRPPRLSHEHVPRPSHERVQGASASRHAMTSILGPQSSALRHCLSSQCSGISIMRDAPSAANAAPGETGVVSEVLRGENGGALRARCARVILLTKKDICASPPSISQDARHADLHVGDSKCGHSTGVVVRNVHCTASTKGCIVQSRREGEGTPIL